MEIHPRVDIEEVSYATHPEISYRPSPTSLLDLPTEILLHIFQDPRIKPVDLYSLSILSKRLNMIAIPLFLNAKSIVDPEDTLTLIFDENSQPCQRHYFSWQAPTSQVEDINELEPLGPEAGIMVAFRLTSVREIRCTFPQFFTDSTTLLRHLSRLHTFLLRLTSLKSLTIHFEGDNRYRHITLNPSSATSFPFADIIGNICRSLAARGCETLLMYNKSHRLQYWKPEVDSREMADQTFNVTSQSPSPKELKVGTRKKGIMGRARAKLGSTFGQLRDTRAPPKLPPKDPHTTYPLFDPSPVSSGLSSLRTLHIQTPFLLLPRCFPHVRNLIHASKDTLTSLSFSHILFEDHLINLCLVALCLDRPNSITHLSITRCRRIPNHTLLTFIRCFQARLEHLELDKDSTCIKSSDDADSPGSPSIHLNELRILKAPLDWIQYFVHGDSWQFDDNEDPTHMAPLPHLTSLTIQCRAPEAPFFEYTTFYPLLDDILHPLHARWKDSSQHSSAFKPRVSLDIALDSAKSWQLEKDRAVFNLLMPSDSRQSWSGGRYTPTPHEQSTRPRPPMQWNLISHLTLSHLQPPEDPYQARILVQWVITLFPGVESVTLPLPYIRHLMTPTEYRARQLALLNSAADFIVKAMRESQIDADSQPVEWRTMFVGQWTFTFYLDVTHGDSFQVASV